MTAAGRRRRPPPRGHREHLALRRPRSLRGQALRRRPGDGRGRHLRRRPRPLALRCCSRASEARRNGPNSTWSRWSTIAGAAPFPSPDIGGYEYTIIAWVDRFASWRHDLARWIAPEDIVLALQAGAALIAGLSRRARGADAKALREWAHRIGGDEPVDAQARRGARRGAGGNRRAPRRSQPRDDVRAGAEARRRSAAARGSAAGTKCSRARPAMDARTAPSPIAKRGCPTSSTWASTCSISRRSIRSD